MPISLLWFLAVDGWSWLVSGHVRVNEGVEGPLTEGVRIGRYEVTKHDAVSNTMWNFQLANEKISSFFIFNNAPLHSGHILHMITSVLSRGDIVFTGQCIKGAKVIKREASVLKGHFQGESEREGGNYFSTHPTFAFNELFTMCNVCFCVCVFVWLYVCMPA